MKNQCLSLMLSAAILTTSPLFAMDKDKDQPAITTPQKNVKVPDEEGPVHIVVKAKITALNGVNIQEFITKSSTPVPLTPQEIADLQKGHTDPLPRQQIEEMEKNQHLNVARVRCLPLLPEEIVVLDEYAKAGVKFVSYFLAPYYVHGIGVTQDIPKATALYKAMAEEKMNTPEGAKKICGYTYHFLHSCYEKELCYVGFSTPITSLAQICKVMFQKENFTRKNLFRELANSMVNMDDSAKKFLEDNISKLSITTTQTE